MLLTNSCRRLSSSAVIFKNRSYSFSTSLNNELSNNREQSSFLSARDWAKQNPSIARKILETPQLPSASLSNSLMKSSTNDLNSFEEYLQFRNWKLPSQVYLDSQKERSPSNDHDKYAMQLISHSLSYPLTLASQSHHFLSSVPKTSTIQHIRLLCIGARAEATLPTNYWREFLCYVENNLSFQQQQNHTSSFNGRIHWTIDFIGPDVPKGIPQRSIPGSSKYHKLDLICHNGYFPQYFTDSSHPKSNYNDYEDLWDGFVLFNPGIGHPNLQSHWISTLANLLTSNETSSFHTKPIIFTAHSLLDSKRDLELLQLFAKENNTIMDELLQPKEVSIHYKPNAFASQMTFVDPFDSTHTVAPNHCIFTWVPNL